MNLIRFIIFLITVFSFNTLLAKSYYGLKYEVAYVDWNKVEGVDLDDILATNINLVDLHYGKEYDSSYLEVGFFVSDSAERSHSANSILGDSLIHFTLDSKHTLMGIRTGIGSKFSVTDNLFVTANGNARYVEQDIEINNSTIKGSTTWKSKVDGKESGVTADAGFGLLYNSGENANLFLEFNGYLAPIGDIDTMGSVNIGFKVKF